MLGGLVVALAVVSARSVQRVRRQQEAWAVCTALQEGRLEDAAASSVAGFSTAELRATECRCLAQVTLGAVDRCVADLEGVLADRRVDDWLPSPELTTVVARSWLEAGRTPEAEQLTERGLHAYPSSSPLRMLRFELLSRRIGEGQTLAQLEDEWEDRGRPIDEWSVFLATRRITRREWRAAIDLLGDQPPVGVEATTWYPAKGMSLAGDGRSDDLSRLFDRWYADGGNPTVILATYASFLSAFGLSDRSADVVEMLARAASQDEQIEDRELLDLLYSRLLGHLSVEGRNEEASRWLERAERRGVDLSRLKLESFRQSTGRSGDESLRGSTGVLLFHLPTDVSRTALDLSPGPEEPVDEPLHRVEAAGLRTLRIERPIGGHPVRWVLRDGERRCERGTVLPRPGATIEVHVSPSPCADAERYEPPAARAADGRRRVALVVLDCADWRLVRYLEARGEAPFLAWAAARGWRGVLASSPPFTAVAIGKLLEPMPQQPSFFGLVHQLGDEVAALRFVGTNPVAALSWVLPSQENAFAVLARGPHRAVDLLHAYGSVGVGGGSTVRGPWGERSELRIAATERALRADEETLFPGLAGTDVAHQQRLREMAADMDLFSEMAARPDVDYLAGRVAALDLTTHSVYPELGGTSQETVPGAGLAAVYRYLDRRLGELYRGLDGDDVLIVMSDHGVRTTLEHDEAALFVAIGDQVPTGRLAGTPEIRGTARMVADLLGVETQFPATGMETWVAALPPLGTGTP